MFELDSVRRTDEETRIALEIIFEEIVINGNQIVLSMNQITDSRWFLTMLSEEKLSKVLQKLFELGYLSVSLYGDYRSLSQYVQRAIDRNLSDSGDQFIFSALPIRRTQRTLLHMMKNALVRADLSELTYYIECAKDEASSEKLLSIFEPVSDQPEDHSAPLSADEARRQLEMIRRFVDLIIRISLNEVSANQAVDWGKESSDCRWSLGELLMKVAEETGPEEAIPGWADACSRLKRIKSTMQEGASYDDRSNWVDALMIEARGSAGDPRGTRALQLAECVVDHCYNYTVESSIRDVSRHYNAVGMKIGAGWQAFLQEFETRLRTDWNEGKDAGSRFLEEEEFDFAAYRGPQPDWSQALRIIGLRSEQDSAADRNRQVPSYETELTDQLKRQKHQNHIGLLTALGVSIGSIILIIAGEAFISVVQEKMENGNITALQSINGWALSGLFYIVLFLLISIGIEKIVPEGDFWLCIKKVFVSLKDLLSLSSIKSVSYSNKREEAVFSPSQAAASPKGLAFENLEEYRMFEMDNPGLFSDSEDLSIFKPSRDYETLKKYQLATGKKLGIVYESPFHRMVVDLVEDETIHTYERVIPRVNGGAVVVISKYGDQFIMLNQYRHAIRKEQITFPRGFGEVGADGNPLPGAQNAVKELGEEINAVVKGTPEYIGSIHPDSGILATKAEVYVAEIESYDPHRGHEGIKRGLLMDAKELEEKIKTGEIDDGYTIAAYAMYDMKRREQ